MKIIQEIWMIKESCNFICWKNLQYPFFGEFWPSLSSTDNNPKVYRQFLPFITSLVYTKYQNNLWIQFWKNCMIKSVREGEWDRQEKKRSTEKAFKTLLLGYERFYLSVVGVFNIPILVKQPRDSSSDPVKNLDVTIHLIHLIKTYIHRIKTYFCSLIW